MKKLRFIVVHFLRSFLLLTVSFNLFAAESVPSPAPVELILVAHSDDKLLPDNFNGLSFEMQRLLPDSDGRYYFRDDNEPLLAIFRTLRIKSLRIGGNTADRPSVPFPNEEQIDRLFAFARKAGVKVIFTLRLREGDPRLAATVAKHIINRHPDVIEAFAIGNEPSVFSPEYPLFFSAWKKFADTINAPEFAPTAVFAGPSSTAGTNKWTRDFARDLAPSGKLRVATQHIYPGGNADLQKDPAEARRLMLSREWVRGYKQFHDAFVPETLATGTPYRLGETNSYWNGGRAEASNTFTAALWALDYQHWWAQHGAQGLNFHTGDFVAKAEENTRSMYSAIWSTPAGYEAKPVAYALTAFAQGARGRVGRAIISKNASDLNITAYLTQDASAAYLTVINKDYGATARDADVSVTTAPAAHVESLRLSTPDGNISRTTGFTLGGGTITENGEWNGRWSPLPPADSAGRITIHVPSASAVVVKLPPVSVTERSSTPTGSSN